MKKFIKQIGKKRSRREDLTGQQGAPDIVIPPLQQGDGRGMLTMIPGPDSQR